MLSVDHSSGEVGFADELLDKLAAKIKAGQRLLIVDDINDSGATIAYLRAAIEAKSGDAAGLRVAVLIDNVRSRAKADYRGSEIDRSRDKSWFVFPWEALGTPRRWPPTRPRCRSGSLRLRCIARLSLLSRLREREDGKVRVRSRSGDGKVRVFFLFSVLILVGKEKERRPSSSHRFAAGPPSRRLLGSSGG